MILVTNFQNSPNVRGSSAAPASPSLLTVDIGDLKLYDLAKL